jgi:TonB family protein
MVKGSRESRRRRRLLPAALTSLALHASAAGLLLDLGRAPEEELVPVSLFIDPGREVRALAGDGLPPGDPAGGGQAPMAGQAPAAGQTPAASPAPAATHRPVVVDILPPSARREARAAPPPSDPAVDVVAAAGPARPLGASRPPATNTISYQPLFVPATASPEEVERIWKMRVLDQQMLVTRQALAAFTEREIEVREPPEAVRSARAGAGATGGDVTAGNPGADFRGAGADVARAGGGQGAGASAEGSGPGSGSAERRLQARLGGRVASGSRVSRAPRLSDELRGWCRTAGGRDPKSVIRLLVDAKGVVGSAFVLRASGDRVFDTCALAFVRGARFEPGLDAAERPLNVWLHAYVSTTTCGDRGCQAQLRLGE